MAIIPCVLQNRLGVGPGGDQRGPRAPRTLPPGPPVATVAPISSAPRAAQTTRPGACAPAWTPDRGASRGSRRWLAAPRTSLPYYSRVPGTSTAAVGPTPDSGLVCLSAQRSSSPPAPERPSVAGIAASTARVQAAPKRARLAAGELVRMEDE